MSNDLKIFSRPFLHIVAASIVAGLALQLEWAIDHDFEYFDFRVFSSALVIFLLVQALRLILRRVSDVPGNFDEKYAEFVLLISIIPIFQLVSNSFLQVVAIVCYLLVLLRFASNTLDIKWCARLWEWAGEGISGLYLLATGKGLRYSVERDAPPGVLKIKIRMKGSAWPLPSEIKKRVVSLYQDLPNSKQYSEVKIDIDAVQTVDEKLLPLLEPVSYYAALMQIDRVAIVGIRERIDKLHTLLPQGGYSFELSDAGGSDGDGSISH